MEKAIVDKKADSSNIFDEFSSDLKDIQEIEDKRKRDVYYYLSLVWGFLKVFNFLLIVFISLSIFYIFIQKSEKNLDISFLSPICSVFIWDAQPTTSECTGVTYLTNEEKGRLTDLKKDQFKKISNVIPDIYAIENFIYSKEVSFLLGKTKDRVKPLQMMVAFDKVKTSFEPIEKTKIKCMDTYIDQNGYFNITCEGYSSDWDKNIIWFNGEKVSSSVEGTSISVANSFINYIEKSSKYFQIVDKQKVFSSEKVAEWIYTRKTTFTLKLKYNNNNNL